MSSASEILIAARRRLGLTQAAAARRIGVPVQTWNAWERGRRQPTAASLLRALAELGVRLPS